MGISTDLPNFKTIHYKTYHKASSRKERLDIGSCRVLAWRTPPRSLRLDTGTDSHEIFRHVASTVITGNKTRGDWE